MAQYGVGLVGLSLFHVRDPNRALPLALAKNDFVLRRRQAGGPYMTRIAERKSGVMGVINRKRVTLRLLGIWIEPLSPDTAEAIAIAQVIKCPTVRRPGGQVVPGVIVGDLDPVILGLLRPGSIERRDKNCPARAIESEE